MHCCCTNSEEGRVAPETATLEEVEVENSDEIIKKRSCTDVVYLVLFGVFLVVMFALLGYCMSVGDIYRIVNGYDDCGNVCGRINSFYDEPTGCRGLDMRDMKYLRVLSEGIESTDPHSVTRACLDTCTTSDQYYTIGNRCLMKPQFQANTFVPKTGLVEFYQEVGEDLSSCWEQMIWLCIIALALSICIMLMFRFMIRVIVWLVLIGVVVVCLSGSIFLWVQYSSEATMEYTDSINKRRRTAYLVFAIVATILTVIVVLVIVALRKRITLVIELFKEAGKACTSMPLMLVEPILTFFALCLLVCLWLYFAIWIESSGQLTIENNTSAKYVKNPTVLVTRWYNVLTLFWMSQFIVGCQNMIIAGAVATWFFTRNKSTLEWPIAHSLARLLRYHLGTVAVGSLIIAIVKVLRWLFRLLELAVENPQNGLTRCLLVGCQCCMGCFESALQYLTRNAYIETAITGLSFCPAGRRATQTLAGNALRVFAINSVGDFVLLLGKTFVVSVTVLIGVDMIHKKEQIHHAWVPLVLVGIFAFFIAHCFITIYEMTIDTIFLCFCEDCDRNDGISKPYYMSRSLMQFVQNSKKSLNVSDSSKASGKAWSMENVDVKRPGSFS